MYSGTWYNERPRDWQNMFSITSFCCIKVLFHMFYYYWGKENCLLYQLLHYIEVRWGGLLQFFWDSVACATIACQTSVLIVHAKMTQVNLRRNENHFSTWKALNLFGICSNSFKLCSNMCLSLGPKEYDKKAL